MCVYVYTISLLSQIRISGRIEICKMDNFTSLMNGSSNATLSGEVFNIGEVTTFYIILFITCVLVLVLDILTSVSVARTPSVRLPIKALLLNLLIANLLNVVAIFLYLMNTLVLAHNQVIEPNAVFCRLLLSSFIITVVERVFALAAFSAVTLAIVIRGISFITPLRLFFSIAVGWALAIILSIDSFIPQILIVQYVDSIACFPDAHATMYADVKTFMDAVYITLGGIVPLIICLVIPIASLCYINHHRVSETGDYTKVLAKFGLFLVASDLVNLLGQTLPTLLALETGALNIYMAIGFAVVSVIPTPILTILFLKPVRKHVCKQLWRCFPYCTNLKRKEVHSNHLMSAHTAAT